MFHVANHDRRPSERRLAVNVIAISDAYFCFEINIISLVRGEHNSADGISKLEHNSAVECVLTNRIDKTPTVEGPVRKLKDEDTKKDAKQGMSNDEKSEECDMQG